MQPSLFPPMLKILQKSILSFFSTIPKSLGDKGLCKILGNSTFPSLEQLQEQVPVIWCILYKNVACCLVRRENSLIPHWKARGDQTPERYHLPGEEASINTFKTNRELPEEQ